MKARIPYILAVLLFTTGAVALSFGQSTASGAGEPGQKNPKALWAFSTVGGTDGASFTGAAVDGAGNITVAGWINGTGTFDFGNGVTTRGTVLAGDPTDYNTTGSVLLVSYDKSGRPRWAQSLKEGAEGAHFTGVAADSAGNVIASGWTKGSGAYGFGSGVISQTASSKGSNPLVVKYDPAGRALWARAPVSLSNSGPAGSKFEASFAAAAVDGDGNVFSAGSVDGDGVVDFGDGVTVTAAGRLSSVLLVKYDSGGKALWARTQSKGLAEFLGVAVDRPGNVYAVGDIGGGDAYSFSDEATVKATSQGYSVLLVKYDASGKAQWARALSSGKDNTRYTAVAVDPMGSVYAAGDMKGDQAFGFGNGVAATGTAPLAERDISLPNLLLVKYSAEGKALWARTLAAGEGQSSFNGVATDGDGNVFACGRITDYDADFGNKVTLKYIGFASHYLVLVKYDPSGRAQWVRSVVSGDKESEYNAVATGAAGEIYAAGEIDTHNANDLGDGVTVVGPSQLPDAANVLVTRYLDSGFDPAFAPTSGLLNDSRVRQRSAPGLDAATVGFLSKGDKVNVIARSDEKQTIGALKDYWYRVRTADGKEGWVFGAFIDLGK